MREVVSEGDCKHVGEESNRVLGVACDPLLYLLTYLQVVGEGSHLLELLLHTPRLGLGRRDAPLAVSRQ